MASQNEKGEIDMPNQTRVSASVHVSTALGQAIDPSGTLSLVHLSKGVTISKELQALAFGTAALVTSVVLSESFSDIPPAGIPTSDPLPKLTAEDVKTAEHRVLLATSTPTPESTPTPTNPVVSTETTEKLVELFSETPKNNFDTPILTPSLDTGKSESNDGTLEIKVNPIPGVEFKYLKNLSDQNAWKLFGALLFIYWTPNLYKKLLLKKEKTSRQKILEELETNLEKALRKMEDAKQVNPMGFREGTDFLVIIQHKEIPYSVLKNTATKIKSITKSARTEVDNISPDLNLAVDKLYTSVMASPVSGEAVIECLRQVILVIKDLGIE